MQVRQIYRPKGHMFYLKKYQQNMALTVQYQNMYEAFVSYNCQYFFGHFYSSCEVKPALQTRRN